MRAPVCGGVFGADPFMMASDAAVMVPPERSASDGQVSPLRTM